MLAAWQKNIGLLIIVCVKVECCKKHAFLEGMLSDVTCTELRGNFNPSGTDHEQKWKQGLPGQVKRTGCAHRNVNMDITSVFSWTPYKAYGKKFIQVRISVSSSHSGSQSNPAKRLCTTTLLKLLQNNTFNCAPRGDGSLRLPSEYTWREVKIPFFRFPDVEGNS